MRFLFIILSILSIASSTAGEGLAAGRVSDNVKDYYVKEIGTREGLSQPSITTVLTDSDGIIWIGTRYRLNRYENSTLVTYDDSQLSGTYVNLIFEDSSSRLWVSTESGLSRYDSDSDRFELVYQGNFYSAAEFAGKLYFAGGKEILILDNITGSISTTAINTSHALACIPEKGGKLIIVDKFSGIYSFDTSSLRSERIDIPELDGDYILSACSTGDGIWLGVYYKGLYKIDSSGRILQRFRTSDFPQLRLEVICDIKQIGSNLWIATDGSGICLLKGDRPVTMDSLPEYSDLNGIPSAVTCLFQDSYSNIWAGSVRDGLIGIKPTSIRNHTVLGAGNDIPDTQVILSMCHDENHLWIGTDGDGIIRYSPQDGSFRRLPLTRGSIISSISICEDDNKILASVYCKGLFKIDKNSGRMETLTIVDDATNEKEMRSGYNQYLFNLTDRKVLIAGGGNWIYDSKDGSFTELFPDFGADATELHPFHVNADKSFAYAFTHSQLYRIDLVRNRISLLYTPQNCGRINTATYDSGKIYIGTDIGLFSYEESTRIWENLSPGLFTRVTRLDVRYERDIWIVADNILYSMDTSTGRFDIYDEAEGFIANEVSTSDRKDHLFYFGGTFGLTVVPASISRTVMENPTLSVSTVKVDGRDAAVKRGDRLRMPVRVNSLEIAFKLTGGDPFRRTLLKYSLSGKVDIEVETYDTVFSIPKLQSGDYTVNASYLCSDGRWSEPVEFIHLFIPDVIWKRTWFISLLLLLFSGMLVLIVHRIRSRADEEIKIAIREHKKDDDKRRSRFVKNIGAEIGSPVSEIITSARQILNNEAGLSDKARAKLEKIYNRSTTIEKALNDVMEREGSQEGENSILSRFNQIIDENISNPSLDVGMLVKEMAMSRSVLYDKIKELTGMGISEYIQKRKLIQAHKYLVETDKSIAEISDLLGFSSPKYFSVVFKNFYEISPREFKKQIAEQLFG